MERRGKNDTSSLPPPTSSQSTSSQHLSKPLSERERLLGIQKRWTCREENEFLRVLTGYGVDLMAGTNCPTPDWHRFKTMAKLEKKSDDSLSDYYKVFIAMCKRKAGVRLTDDEKEVDGIINDISEDHARLILDRLELLSKLREVVKHPRVEERLTLCNNNYDTPDWWESGHHDRELIRAVLKHGLYRSEYYIFNDPTYSFGKSEKMFIEEVESHLMKAQLAEAEASEVLRVRSATIKREQLEQDAAMSVKKEIESDEVVIVKSEKPIVIIDEIVIKDDDSDTEASEAKQETVISKTDSSLPEGEENKTDNTEEKIEDQPPTQIAEETPVKSPKSTEDVVDDSKPCDDEKMEVDSVETAAVDEQPQDKDANELPTVDETKNEAEVLDKKEIEEDQNTELPKVMEAEPETEAESTEKTEMEIADDEAVIDAAKDKSESDDTKMVVDEEKGEPKKIEEEDSTLERTTTVSDEATEDTSSSKTEVVNKDELPVELTTSGDPDDDDVMKEKEKAVEEECKKQAADLKARFPDLEVIQPLAKPKPAVDMKVLKGKFSFKFMLIIFYNTIFSFRNT